jgi:hypothetical protein
MHNHSHAHPSHTHVHHDPVTGPRAQHVVLDIGGDIGALVVKTDRELLGVEVEISPAGDDAGRSHKQVLERASGGQSAPVLVFDNLASGAYTLWVDGVAAARDVHVVGGTVAELDWRATRDWWAPGVEGR